MKLNILTFKNINSNQNHFFYYIFYNLMKFDFLIYQFSNIF